MLVNTLNRQVRQRQGFPILPGAFPIVGHLPAIRTDFLNLLRRAEREVGPHFWLDFGFGSQELTCVLPDAYSLLKNKVTASIPYLEIVPDIVGDTLLVLEGQAHRDTRSAINGPFQPNGLDAVGIGAAFAEAIERWVRAWQARRNICLWQETGELALSLMFRMLGIDETRISVWRKQYQRFASLVYAPPIDLPGMPRPRGRRASAWMEEQIRGFIREARAQPQAPGLLTALVRAFDGSDTALSETHLLATARFLLFAGHDTTAAAMAWIVIVLAQWPGVWDALCAEAIAGGTPPRSPKELSRFPYANAVFRETVRFYPPTPMVKRRALVDLELGGRTVPAGTDLCIPAVHLLRLAERYERPEEFLPERWLDNSRDLKAFETLPFGGGPHFCLGYHLAWLEIVQFAVTLALTMSANNLRPRLSSKRAIRQRYLPLGYPPAATRVVFE